MMSHDNLRIMCTSLARFAEMRENTEVIVSYLPLSHIAASMLDIWIAIYGKATVYFADKTALKVKYIDRVPYFDF